MDGIVTLLQVVEANADNEDLVESALLAIASFATDGTILSPPHKIAIICHILL